MSGPRITVVVNTMASSASIREGDSVIEIDTASGKLFLPPEDAEAVFRVFEAYFKATG